MYAYLDVSGNVLATSKVSRTVAEIQGKAPAVTTKITGAPDTIRHKSDFDPNINLYHQKISGDGTDISHYTTVVYLVAVKRVRRRAIDTKSRELMDAGFEYPASSGNMFSLSDRAQSKIHAVSRMGPGRFPHPISMLDDTRYIIPDAATADLLRKAMVTRLHKQILGPGSDLKQDVNDAATQTVLDAITDTRT